MENRGTKEGDIEEINFVKKFNAGKFKSFTDYYYKDLDNIYCVHVTTDQYSNTSKQNVKPKSDAYLVRLKNIKSESLSNLSHYINEDNIHNFDYSVLPNSGISIKLSDSNKYQIHKFTPLSFLAVFKNRYLGAGAMIYSKNEEDITDNTKVLEIWNLSLDDFLNYFTKLNGSLLKMDIESCKFIQKYCLNEIKNIINHDKSISDLVFTGEGVFSSPYFAYYGFIKGELSVFKKTDFSITTGSGRLKSPTIVVKPK